MQGNCIYAVGEFRTPKEQAEDKRLKEWREEQAKEKWKLEERDKIYKEVKNSIEWYYQSERQVLNNKINSLTNEVYILRDRYTEDNNKKYILNDMSNMLELIENIKLKIADQEYIDLVNELKKIYDNID